MGTDNREQGKDSQSQFNKPAQGKYDQQNKGQAVPGKDAHLGSKEKPVDPSTKKAPENFVK